MSIPEDQVPVPAEAEKWLAELSSEVANSANRRETVLRMEARIAAAPQIELEVLHHFSKGLYAREMHIPKGVILAGEIHRFQNLNILSKGRISLFTEHEGQVTLEAPCTIVSRPGVKRIGYAHEDVVWTTIHATTETDVEKIKEEVIAKDFNDPVLLEQIQLLTEEV